MLALYLEREFIEEVIVVTSIVYTDNINWKVIVGSYSYLSHNLWLSLRTTETSYMFDWKTLVKCKRIWVCHMVKTQKEVLKNQYQMGNDFTNKSLAKVNCSVIIYFKIIKMIQSFSSN